MPKTPKTSHSILAEEILTFLEVCRMFPPLRNGRPVSASAVWKWANRGMLVRDGTRLKLEVVKIGSRIVTSREAVERFCNRLTEDRLAE